MASSFPPVLSSASDLALSLSGDLVIGPTGDLEIVSGENALLQEIIVRLKTRKGDARYSSGMGTSLDTLIGQPCSPDTGLAAENLVLSALTHDGLFLPDEVSVLTIPTSETAMAIIITCNTSRLGYGSSGEIISLEMTLDLQEGLLL